MPYLATRWQGVSRNLHCVFLRRVSHHTVFEAALAFRSAGFQPALFLECGSLAAAFSPPKLASAPLPHSCRGRRNLSRPGREPGSLSPHSFTPSCEGPLATAVSWLFRIPPVTIDCLHVG